MPISRSAKKSLRKSINNKRVNVAFKSLVKKTVKEFLAKPSQDAFKKVASVLDKAVKKNIYHNNKSSRLKSRLSKKITKTTKKESKSNSKMA